MLIQPGKLLGTIDSPNDLKKLDQAQLVQLCEELRNFIIDNVSVYGGHFGASLGVVELTVALHYVFNTPKDQLVWDVGHQAYGHKILTGRRDEFHTNRMYKGISGFPKRSENEYDSFGVGHSSTSVSAALGMAVASKYLKKDQHDVPVIGDGVLTSIPVTHSLNSTDVSVNLFEVSSGMEVHTRIVRTNANTVTLSFTNAPTSGQYRVIIRK